MASIDSALMCDDVVVIYFTLLYLFLNICKVEFLKKVGYLSQSVVKSYFLQSAYTRA